jgi:hypothetical protein
MMDRISAWAEHRNAPIVATVAMLVVGPLYVIAYGTLRLHGLWITSSDMWVIARSAAAITHGQFSHVYAPGAAMASPPALEFVQAPLVALGAAMGLHPLQPNTLQAPYLWTILGPANILLGSTALFAVDAVARRWNLSDGRRLALALACALWVGNVVVFWGHPEDCLAVALAIWGALAMDRGDEQGLHRAGWLVGLAIAFQPLALLAVLPVFARCRRGDLPGLALRLALPSLVVLVPPLIAAPSWTLSVLVHQPSYPTVVSSTPFSSLAPSLGHTIAGGARTVSGGPMRLLSTLLGMVLAFAVCRRRYTLVPVLSMMAVAFALRVLLETELVGYYFVPLALLCLLLAGRRGWPSFWVGASASTACLVLGNYRVHHIIVWWPALMVTVLVMVAAAVPNPWRDETPVAPQVDPMAARERSPAAVTRSG